MLENTFKSTDGKTTVHWYKWDVENPVAVLQIVHGMSEYIERYDVLAKYLNEHGIVVVGNDHIGHGKSVESQDDWGYFGESDGWKVFVQDTEELRKMVKSEYPDIPYFILGHSMGSFVTRAWLKMFGEGIDGAIIMGTAGSNPALGAGRAISKLLRTFKGGRHRSKLVTAMAFGSYNKRIPNAKSYNDWLTRDDEIVASYRKDPACGFSFTLSGYIDLFNLLEYIQGDQWASSVQKDLPMLFVAGGEDPVGSYGAGPAEVVDRLNAAGCEDVSLIIYDGMRHEVLNEIGK
ncbi:MAG: alpha/beta hydrolase, partial [Bacillota bacterium]|nr:alpha/beta hydrolase [Bacillota bacterium]